MSSYVFLLNLSTYLNILLNYGSSSLLHTFLSLVFFFFFFSKLPKSSYRREDSPSPERAPTPAESTFRRRRSNPRRRPEASDWPSCCSSCATQKQPSSPYTYQWQSKHQQGKAPPWPWGEESISQSSMGKGLLPSWRLWRTRKTRNRAAGSGEGELRSLQLPESPCFCKSQHMELCTLLPDRRHRTPCKRGRRREEPRRSRSPSRSPGRRASTGGTSSSDGRS